MIDQKFNSEKHMFLPQAKFLLVIKKLTFVPVVPFFIFKPAPATPSNDQQIKFEQLLFLL